MEPTPDECTIYEVVYPDDRRRVDGSVDEAVSRAFFESPGAAASFRDHNGGTIVSRVVPIKWKRYLQRLRKI